MFNLENGTVTFSSTFEASYVANGDRVSATFKAPAGEKFAVMLLGAIDPGQYDGEECLKQIERMLGSLGFVSANSLEHLLAEPTPGKDRFVNDMMAVLARYKPSQAQPSQAVPHGCRQLLIAQGKPYPKSSCSVCGAFAPKSQQCDQLINA